MDISIIIVNWNSVGFLRKCLKSVYENTRHVSFETVVVDNASYDGSAEMVAIEFPMVKFVQSVGNLGFSGANNLGYSHSRGRNLLFLNPDTEVLGEALSDLVHALDSMPEAGALGCMLLNTDMTVQTSCIQAFPTILNQVLDCELLHSACPKSRIWKTAPLYEDSENLSEVDVVSGACMMVKRSVFEIAGLFSRDYFMYAEDLDLCHKIRQSGYKVYFVKKISVIHHGGGSSARHAEKSFSAIQMRESIYKFLKRTRGKYYAVLYKVTTSVISIFRLLVISVVALIMILTGKNGTMAQAFKKWRGILRWSLGLERWVR